MKELAGQESDDQLTEEINKIKLTALAEGAVECHVCGEKLREGDSVIAFVYRPVEQPAFEIGHVKCTECRHEPSEFFTLGVRELVVEGRVGCCTDKATQSSWPVLLAPQPRAVSSADTTGVQPLPGIAWFRQPVAQSDAFMAVDRGSRRKPWQRSVVRVDSTDSESMIESESDLERATDSVETAGPRAPDGGRQGGVR
jgi:hypothetical protein